MGEKQKNVKENLAIRSENLICIFADGYLFGMVKTIL